MDRRAGRAGHQRTPCAAAFGGLGCTCGVARPGARGPRAGAAGDRMRRITSGRALASRPVPAALRPDEDGEESLAGRPREFIQSLERGLGIITAFGPHAPEQTVSEL